MIYCVTGPESSGKTSLALNLSAALALDYVPEVARHYLRNKPSYEMSDLIAIAHLQADAIQKARLAKSTCIADTDLLTIVIWSRLKFGEVPQELISLWKANLCDFYFLCKPNIPWQFDPLREDQFGRDLIFEEYLAILKSYHLPFAIIRGNGKQRILEAENFLRKKIN